MTIETPGIGLTIEKYEDKDEDEIRETGDTFVGLNNSQGEGFKFLHTLLDPQELVQLQTFVNKRVEQLGFAGYL